MRRRKFGNGHNGRPASGSLTLFRSYKFVDKDPAIDKLRTIVQDEGVYNFEQLHLLTGSSSTTFKNMFEGKTRRPQNATLARAADALGYDWGPVKRTRGSFDLDRELKKAKTWWKIHAPDKHKGRKPER